MVRTRRRSCTGKVSNPTKQQADAQRMRMAQQWGFPPDRWESYSCDYCGGWHVGNTGDPDNPRNRYHRKK